MNEAETRRQLIDLALARAGWNINDPSQVSLEFEIPVINPDPTPPSPDEFQYSDYLLLAKDQRALAVVEAKRTSRSPQVGREQALQYAQHIQRSQGGELPLVFYTNGHETWYWDSERYPPRKVHGFPTRTELERIRFLARERRALSVELVNTEIVERPYQIEAIRSVMEGIEAKRRKFLLVMATGTGKTRVCTAIFDVLMRARWAERVLFLVDRIALRDQALNEAFRPLLPNAPSWPQTDDHGFVTNRRIYVGTYPTMLNLLQAETPYLSPHFFDVVVADESHRSIYNVYKQVLDYFDAIQIGLTATPTDYVDHDTFTIFDCDVQIPTFAYSYEEAVRNTPPYLCDFEVLRVRSKFQLEGIKGQVLPASEQRSLIAEGLDLENIDFEGTDLERKVSNSGTNRVIVKEFMDECITDPSGTLPGKTIIFAISKAHAWRLEELFNALYPEHNGKLARVIVSDDDRVHGKGGLLDQFKNHDMPRVAISVDMLDTGIDLREIVNLVFAKPVYSYTKFWQMIGRGTRVLEADPAKRRAWCPEKDKFLIIDCWGNFEFFKMNPAGREPGQQVPLPVRLFRKRLDKLEAAEAAGRGDVVAQTKDALRADLRKLPQNNVVVLDNAPLLLTVEPQQFWDRLDVEGVGYLRGKVAPVLRARSAEDFKAMRFETNVVELSTAMLEDNQDAYQATRDVLIEQVGELPLTVNTVAREKDLIEDLLHGSFWNAVTEDKLADLVARLAPLMRFRQRRTDPLMKLNLSDLVAVKEWVDFGPEHERLSTAAYRDRVEAHVRHLVQRNPVLQKLQRGELVTDEEVSDLARILADEDPFVTEELLRRVYDHKKARFIQFIRHILGLEKLDSWAQTVTTAFDRFVADHNTLTSLQIRFIQTLRTFVLQTGKVERRDLIAAPFTQLHPQGIRGVFQNAEIDEIVTFAQQVAG